MKRSEGTRRIAYSQPEELPVSADEAGLQSAEHHEWHWQYAMRFDSTCSGGGAKPAVLAPSHARALRQLAAAFDSLGGSPCADQAGVYM